MNFIKNILATIWLISWAFRLRNSNDYAPKAKAEGERALEGE